MAFLDSTIFLDLQTKIAQNEKFTDQHGLIRIVRDSGQAIDFLSPDEIAAMNKMSSARGQRLPVLKDQTVTVVTTPGFSFIPNNIAETAYYGFTAFDVFSGFKFYPAAHSNNQVTKEYYVRNVTENVLKAMATSIEGLIINTLDGRRTQVLGYTDQVSAGDGTVSFSEVTDLLTLNKAAVKDAMFYNLQALMVANKLPGDYRLVTSPAGIVAQQAELFKYGDANTKNLRWSANQLPPDMYYQSHAIAPGVDNLFTGYMIRDGAIGLVENYPYNFMEGTTLNGKRWMVSDIELPYVNMRANVYMNTEATDADSVLATSDSNLKMTTFEEMAIWCRFYLPYRYNSSLSTRQQDIVKLQGTKA